MAQGVHSRLRRGRGRQRQRQFRVQKRQFRIQIRTVHAFLLFEVLPDKNGRKGHFAAGSGGGGNHDFRQPGLGNFIQAQIIRGLAFIRRNDRNGLGHIHCRASADADHDVAFVFDGQRRPFIRQFNAGLRLHLVKKGNLDPVG